MYNQRALLVTLLLVLVCVTSSEGAQILAVFPSLVGSHHVIIQPILKTLAQAGHHLVVYTSFPIHDPPANMAIELFENEEYDIVNIIQAVMSRPRWKCFDLSSHDFKIRRVFDNHKIKTLLHSNITFDLILTESFFLQEFMSVFGHIFDAPVISIQTTFTNFISNVNLGNSLSIASIPAGCLSHSNKMTFVDRLQNSFYLLRAIYFYYNDYVPDVERIMRSYFPEMPPMLDLMKTVSLVFINDHMTADYAQPRLPNMIPVGGIHIEAEKPLPQDTKRFMDGASEGVILFSLGTVVPDEMKPKECFEMFTNVFRRLSQKVVWKTSMEKIKGLPENVRLMKWLPQRDILAHPNCVLFITHGGLASQHETIYNAVPVVGIPHLADQFRNVEYYRAQEVGLSILPEDLSEDALLSNITAVISNPKYRENVRRLSRIFKDRPMSPAESVVFWTEYVLRHGGAPHLKPASTQLSWYQLALLDVLAVIAAGIVFILFILFSIHRFLSFVINTKTKTNVPIRKKKRK